MNCKSCKDNFSKNELSFIFIESLYIGQSTKQRRKTLSIYKSEVGKRGMWGRLRLGGVSTRLCVSSLNDREKKHI